MKTKRVITVLAPVMFYLVGKDVNGIWTPEAFDGMPVVLVESVDGMCERMTPRDFANMAAAPDEDW